MKYNAKVVLIILLFKYASMLNDNSSNETEPDDTPIDESDNATEAQKDFCKNYTDCFNCSFGVNLNNQCYWNGTTCIEQDQSFTRSTRGDWRKKYATCTDEASKALINTYCGMEITKELNSTEGFKNHIKLPLGPHGKYGKQNIVCGWVHSEEEISDLLYLYIEKNAFIPLGLELNFGLYSRFYSIVLHRVNISIAGVRSVSFYFQGFEEYDAPPFEMQFEFREYKKSGLLTFVLWCICLICILVLIAILLFLVFFSRKISQHKERERRSKRERKTNDKEEERQSTHSSPLAKKGNSPLNTQNRTYSEELSKSNTLCAICFRLFILGGDVILLNCSHLFHVDCLAMWKEKVKTNFFCPNCHQKMIEYNIQKQSEFLSLINLNQIENLSE